MRKCSSVVGSHAPRGLSQLQQHGQVKASPCLVSAVDTHSMGTSSSCLSQRLLLEHKAAVTTLAVGGSGGHVLASSAAAQPHDKSAAAVLLWDLPSGRRLCSISGALA
jgi:hypothetical protein